MKYSIKKILTLTSVLANMMIVTSCGQKLDARNNLNQSTGSIVGGEAVKAGEYQSVVALVRNHKSFCTGNLIAVNKVVTAAHCVTTFDYNNKTEVQTMMMKVITEVQKLMPNKSFAEFMALGPADQDRLFRASVKLVLEKDTAGIKLHFGLGNAGLGATLGSSLDLVGSVTLPKEAMDFAVATFMSHTILKTAADEAATYNTRFDIAYLELKSDVTDVRPVPVISANEHADSVVLGQDVTLVGYGLRMDPSLVRVSASVMVELEESIETETDATKKEALKLELKAEEVAFMQMFLEYSASGNKNTVKAKLENYDHESMTLKRKSSTLQGACFGDSGGPAFVTTKTGQLRQLGVMVTVDYCGNKTEVSPIFNH